MAGCVCPVIRCAKNSLTVQNAIWFYSDAVLLYIYILLADFRLYPCLFVRGSGADHDSGFSRGMQSIASHFGVKRSSDQDREKRSIIRSNQVGESYYSQEPPQIGPFGPHLAFLHFRTPVGPLARVSTAYLSWPLGPSELSLYGMLNVGWSAESSHGGLLLLQAVR